MTIGTGVWQAIKGIKDGKPREVSKGVTGIGTTFFGGWGGEALGAAIGSSIFPGVGSVIGGIVGGVAGAITANMAGDAVVDKIHDKFGSDVCDECKEFSKKSKEEIEAELKDLQEMFDNLKDKNTELEEQIKAEQEKYIRKHPIPEDLKNHLKKHPNSFNIQIIGSRGVGKSSFINRFFKYAELRNVFNSVFI